MRAEYSNRWNVTTAVRMRRTRQPITAQPVRLVPTCVASSRVFCSSVQMPGNQLHPVLLLTTDPLQCRVFQLEQIYWTWRTTWRSSNTPGHCLHSLLNRTLLYDLHLCQGHHSQGHGALLRLLHRPHTARPHRATSTTIRVTFK